MAERIDQLPFLGTGLGYREPLRAFMQHHRGLLDFVEITAEHFFDGAMRQLLAELKASYPLVVHGLDLSLGTPGELSSDKLAAFAEVARAADAKWVSEHIAFTQGPLSGSAELGHLLPVLPTAKNVELIISHVHEIEDATGLPVILENITSHLQLEGTLSEAEFINRIVEGAGCGILLDITNLYINSINHSFSALEFLEDLRLDRVVEIHLVGFSASDYGLEDLHRDAVQDELLEILRLVHARGQIKAVLLERDGLFADTASIEGDLTKIRSILESDPARKSAVHA